MKMTSNNRIKVIIFKNSPFGRQFDALGGEILVSDGDVVAD